MCLMTEQSEREEGEAEVRSGRHLEPVRRFEETSVHRIAVQTSVTPYAFVPDVQGLQLLYESRTGSNHLISS
jgi:hypothetical protein